MTAESESRTSNANRHTFAAVVGAAEDVLLECVPARGHLGLLNLVEQSAPGLRDNFARAVARPSNAWRPARSLAAKRFKY